MVALKPLYDDYEIMLIAVDGYHEAAKLYRLVYGDRGDTVLVNDMTNPWTVRQRIMQEYGLAGELDKKDALEKILKIFPK